MAKDQPDYEAMLQEMKKFYTNASSYLATDLVTDNVYVARRNDSSFIRVRLVSIFPNVIKAFLPQNSYLSGIIF